MKKILLLLLITITSCVIPQHIEPDKCCDKHTYYRPHYPQTRVVIVKKNKLIPTKRSIKVKVNKHRKRK